MNKEILPVPRIGGMSESYFNATSQHFATVFKRMTGLAPNSFRKRGLENVSPETIHRGYGPNYHARLTRF